MIYLKPQSASVHCDGKIGNQPCNSAFHFVSKSPILQLFKLVVNAAENNRWQIVLPFMAFEYTCFCPTCKYNSRKKV